ncbi:MAG: hypothetical protein NTV86_16690, partial [Planctomycetota bacterium]|nr:hypothetical protein [Planctomycetota bacterium]
GRNRLLAVAVGVAVPTAAAVVVLYLVLRHRPEAAEVDAEEDRQWQLAAMEPQKSLDHATDLLPVATRQPEGPGLPADLASEAESNAESAPASTESPPAGGTG